MQVMVKSFTGQHVSPTYGGEWSISNTTLQYAPLVVLPLKEDHYRRQPFPTMDHCLASGVVGGERLVDPDTLGGQ